MSFIIAKISPLIVISAIFSLLGVAYTQAQEIQATIIIPAIQVNAPIVDAPLAGTTWDVSHLNMTVGRFESMPWFGSNTNVVLGGHSIGTAGQPDVFYHLEYMEVGDEIFVEVDGVQYRYVVSEKRNVTDTAVEVLYPTSHSQLTLLACDTQSFDGTTYTRRTVIIATEIQ